MKPSRTERAARSDPATAPPREGKALPKPRKRPTQDRAKFTVEALYDAYVRIWRRDGSSGVTTRSVAEEAGFAIGTLYEYFPNKQALHSGYVRFTLDWLLARIEREVTGTAFTDWRDGMRRLAAITCGAEPDQPFFDVEMLDLVSAVAEPKHHRRVFAELTAKWAAAIEGWPDLQPKPAERTVEALVLAAWGARRYALLVDPGGERLPHWAEEMATICIAALEPR